MVWFTRKSVEQDGERARGSGYREGRRVRATGREV